MTMPRSVIEVPATAADKKSSRRKRYTRGGASLRVELTDRDIDILKYVRASRFLRSTHIIALVDGSPKKLTERLGQLFHAGLLDRPRAQIDYHADGSTPMVYALGQKGAFVLAERFGGDDHRFDWARKNQRAGRRFVDHTLSIADVHIALTLACRNHPAAELLSAHTLHAKLPEATQLKKTPWLVSAKVPIVGQMQDLGVVPDYVFGLRLHDDTRRCFVVECDRGTMPIVRKALEQTSMLRKLLTYDAAWRAKFQERAFGWKNFRVLIITSDATRAETIRRAVASLNSGRGSELFLITHAAHLDAVGVLTDPWRDGKGRSVSLVPELARP